MDQSKVGLTASPKTSLCCLISLNCVKEDNNNQTLLGLGNGTANISKKNKLKKNPHTNSCPFNKKEIKLIYAIQVKTDNIETKVRVIIL